jgi:hypothetical protein
MWNKHVGSTLCPPSWLNQRLFLFVLLVVKSNVREPNFSWQKMNSSSSSIFFLIPTKESIVPFLDKIKRK